MQFPVGRAPRAHICGIGGTAMVAGARLAIEAGWEVRGSDNPLYPPTSDMVKALGVPVAEGYAAANLDWEPDVVLIGNVLSRGNAEVEAALSRKLRFQSLPEWMKDVVLRARRPVVICGTHGKTTTTALTAYLLDAAGLAPAYLIGGQPLDFEHSARLGAEGVPFVIEGDEYDTAFFDKRAKFLHYLPDIAVVTSVEFDHGDIYRDVEEIETAFRRMLRQIPKEGLLLTCADSPRALALRDHAYSRVETYGFAPDADWRGMLGGVDDTGRALLTIHRNGAEWGRFRVPLAGRHNAQNAIAAIAVAAHHGASACGLADALASFKGVRRRMEIFHEAEGITFIDDFAHHPTAVAMSLGGLRQRYPGRRLVALFEPRSLTAGRSFFFEPYLEAFRQADLVLFAPIFYRERLGEKDSLDIEGLRQGLAASGITSFAEASNDAVLSRCLAETRPGDVVVTMSSGSFDGMPHRVLAALRQAAAHLLT